MEFRFAVPEGIVVASRWKDGKYHRHVTVGEHHVDVWIDEEALVHYALKALTNKTQRSKVGPIKLDARGTTVRTKEVIG
jgi:hypothetical protein